MNRLTPYIEQLAYQRRFRVLFAELANAAISFDWTPSHATARTLKLAAKRLYKHDYAHYIEQTPPTLTPRELRLWQAAMLYAAYGAGQALGRAAQRFARGVTR